MAGCQSKEDVEVGEIGEGIREVQTSSYITSKSWGCNTGTGIMVNGVITVRGDRWFPDLSWWRFTAAAVVQLLSCV